MRCKLRSHSRPSATGLPSPAITSGRMLSAIPPTCGPGTIASRTCATARFAPSNSRHTAAMTLPVREGQQFAQNVNTRLTDEIIGGYQLSYVLSWSGGLPFTASFNECGQNVPGTPNPATITLAGAAPCRPNVSGHMKTHLTSAVTNSGGKITRSLWQQQIPCAHPGCSAGANGDLDNPLDVAAGTGLFTNPGLDNFGNGGLKHL